MNWKRVAISLAAGLAGLCLATIPASAQCNVAYSHSALTSSFQGPFTEPLDLNAEGLTERPADFVINGVGCFTPGNSLEVSFNAVMSVPSYAAFIAGQGTYWNFNDPSGALNLSGPPTVVTVEGTGGKYVTKIIFPINSGTVDPGAEFLLKNLRFDVTGTTGTTTTPYAQVPDGGILKTYVDTTNPPTSASPFYIGYVYKTVSGAGVSQVGWGFEDGLCPFLFCPFPNKGGSGTPAPAGYLLQQAYWWMTTNSNSYSTGTAFALDFPFRRVGEGWTTTLNVLDPNYIGPTDLIVDVEDIPSGVTVTLPQYLYICGSEDSTLVIWKAISSVGPQTGTEIATIYQTTYAGPVSGTLNVQTGYAASTGGCPVTNTIGVVVNDPSGTNPDGNMQANLRVLMGPTRTAAFTVQSGGTGGDDVQATAVPVYLTNITGSAPTREIIGDSAGNPVPYFFLNPTETVLLYPYVTNLDGWDTGIEVGNTGNDAAVFGNTGQNGALDFYFFPTPVSSASGVPFACTTAIPAGSLTPCNLTIGNSRGLNYTTGVLNAGGDFAVTLNGLLTAYGYAGNFDGYIIIVAHFNFGHGAGMLFDTAGNISALPALILGGHCSYNFNNAQQLITGAPSWPACSSARQGDITKLPERLDN